jgi:hypothetical protein
MLVEPLAVNETVGATPGGEDVRKDNSELEALADTGKLPI